jgi:hypothetical protein
LGRSEVHRSMKSTLHNGTLLLGLAIWTLSKHASLISKL